MINGLTSRLEVFRPGPEAVTSYGELREALVQLTEKSGCSLRQLESRVKAQGGALRKSTLSDALQGRHKFSRRMVVELTQACGETEDAVTAWDEAWQRAERDRRGRTGHLGAVRRLPSEAREIIDLGIAEIFRIGDRHGVPRAEIEVYVRQRAASERRWLFGAYWVEPPESWVRAVDGSTAGFSRRVDEALSSILAAERNQPVDEQVLSRIVQVLMEAVLGTDATTTRDSLGDASGD
jgi:hypothetical protein